MPKQILLHTSDDDFKQHVTSSKHWYEMIKKCGFKMVTPESGDLNDCRYHQNHKKSVLKRINAMGLSSDHLQRKTHIRKRLANNELRKVRRSTSYLKKILTQSKREYICERCKCERMTLVDGEWMWYGSKIVLQIDHIHGLKGTEEDDKAENLRYLCANCHTQTNTWGGNWWNCGLRKN